MVYQTCHKLYTEVGKLCTVNQLYLSVLIEHSKLFGDVNQIK